MHTAWRGLCLQLKSRLAFNRIWMESPLDESLPMHMMPLKLLDSMGAKAWSSLVALLHSEIF